MYAFWSGTTVGIPELWDTSVPVINGACIDAICSSLPYHGARKTVSVLRCCTSTYYFVEGPHGLGHGSRLRTGLTGRDFRDQGCVYAITPQTEFACQSVIPGTFLLFLLWARVLFDFSASHLFVVASCVKDLSLEVETSEQPLHVSFPLGTRVRVDQICQDYELEISGILLTVDLRVKDMLEFEVIHWDGLVDYT